MTILTATPAAFPPASDAAPTAPPGCPDRACAAHNTDRLLTAANVLTLLRTLACLVLATAAVPAASLPLLLAALAVHWAGDIADGAIARRRDEETVTGAVLDIVADRLCVAVVYLAYAALVPAFAVPVAVYLLEFMLVDTLLSLVFLRWRLSGPNYFARIDPLVWRVNWWPPAKAVNGGLVAVVCVVGGWPTVAVAAAAALLVIKIVCLARVTTRLGRRGEPCMQAP